jgi:glucose-6-phosphate isomerase
MSPNVKFEYYPIINDALVEDSLNILKQNQNNWDPPFFFDTKKYLDIENVRKIAKQFLNDNLKNIIVLGTGGSIQTLLALKHLAKKKIFPVTSSRAVELKGCLDKTSPDNSVVIPISRGGETLDVNATIGIFLQKGYKFLGLSSAGSMLSILKEINCPILNVHNLSGRYAGSITNVGIIPAYLAGIDIEMFLKGLKESYEIFLKFEKNPALELAVFLFQLYNKGYKGIFSMPYSKNLEGSVGLWVQGISESTGKDEKGMIGTYQSAPICQHSVLEYLLGGTKGIIIPILWTITNEYPDFILESSINYVNGKSAQTIVNYQADATFQALIQQQVPSAKISIENPSEYDIGCLVAHILASVYYLCLLINVNWANNPKVIIGKKICNEALKDETTTSLSEQKRKKIAEEKFRTFFE